MMARIRSKNTKPEVLTRSVVYALGMRFRNHVDDLPGKPDLANKTRKWAIFVHGCFWHSHAGCRLASSPKSNTGYWTGKLARNRVRDSDKIAALKAKGLTHPDLDHVKGFKELLKRVVIGELWFTPRVFWEYKKDLSPDALAFCEEAQRRVKRTIAAGGDPGRGNRVRLIGYDDLLGKDDYRGFPRKFLTIPGQSIEIVDGQDLSQFFSAFVHAPFKDDSAGERNETSLALQVRLYHGRTVGSGLFFGDLSYPTIRRIFDETHRHDNDDRLVWDVHLSSHHCSKKVMYVRNQDGNDVLMQDILDELNAVQADDGCIVASSSAFPASNSPGDNPPHIKARRRYEEIATGGFICTGEYSTPENMRPVVFSVTERGVIFVGDALELSEESRSTLAKAVAAARGTDSPVSVDPCWDVHHDFRPAVEARRGRVRRDRRGNLN